MPKQPTVKLLGLGFFVGLVILGRVADAEEGLAGFGHIAEPAGNAEAPWGPVPTEYDSLANSAPVLLPFFNNAPVFGLPGTVLGDFWDRTQLSGDWGGVRTDLARHGLFFDLYSTSTYQDVLSGGLKTGSAFVQNTQLSINLDTGRAGLWPGGLFHFTAQSRYGDSPQNTFTVGSFVPQYTGLVEPESLLWHDTNLANYYLVQELSKTTYVILGKISTIFIPDQTLFGDSYKYYFANFNFSLNPLTTYTYGPTAWAALGGWAPAPWLAFLGGVLDPYSEANNFATDAFSRVNLFLTAIWSYQLGGLPGRFEPSFNWSNKPKIDLRSPFGQLLPEQVPQAVGALVGGPSTGLPINYESQTGFVIANVSQYLYVKEQDAAAVAQDLKTGQQINGIGVYGRFGFAPQESAAVAYEGSAALFGRGLLDGRKYDSFGVGVYYNGVSGDLKNSIAQLTAGKTILKNETGIEVFYDFAITPAVRLIPSYQHVWNPLTAAVVSKQTAADVFLLRLTEAW